MNDDPNLPDRAPRPVETRSRNRATAVASMAESPRPTRNRRYVRLAAAGVVALAAVAVVEVTQAGDDQATTPPSTMDRFADGCVAAVDRAYPADERAWTAAAFATDGKVGALTIRNQNQSVVCEGVPGPNGAMKVGPLIGMGQLEPSDVPGLWLIPFSNTVVRPPSYPLILGGMVSRQASGMTLTLSDGTSVEADIADETAITLVRWNGHSAKEAGTTEMSNKVMKELIVSVRVVDADGDVLYEGPPT